MPEDIAGLPVWNPHLALEELGRDLLNRAIDLKDIAVPIVVVINKECPKGGAGVGTRANPLGHTLVNKRRGPLRIDVERGHLLVEVAHHHAVLLRCQVEVDIDAHRSRGLAAAVVGKATLEGSIDEGGVL